MKTTKIARTLLLAAALLGTSAVRAQDADPNDLTQPGLAIAGRWYVSPMGSYTFADKQRDTDDGIGGALLIGKPIRPGVNLEAHVFYTEYDLETGNGKVDLTGIGADVMAFPFGGGLFGLLGLAFSDGDSDAPVPAGQQAPSADSVVGDLGLGYLFGPLDFLNKGGLRAEARGRFDKRVDKNTDDYFEPVLSLGLLIPIGPVPPPPGATPVGVVPTVAGADSDGDGVADDLDQCPDSPSGTAVDAVGCPLAPQSTEVADGALDLSDANAGDKFVLRGVNFEFDSSILTTRAREILTEVIGTLLESPIKVEVGGHTDSLGTDGYNLGLSERRAQAVVKFLKAGGIAADRMVPIGYGETAPIASNDTEAGQASNRRVELTVTEAAR